MLIACFWCSDQPSARYSIGAKVQEWIDHPDKSTSDMRNKALKNAMSQILNWVTKNPLSGGSSGCYHIPLLQEMCAMPIKFPVHVYPDEGKRRKAIQGSYPRVDASGHGTWFAYVVPTSDLSGFEVCTCETRNKKKNFFLFLVSHRCRRL